jgi:hypothetical protein
MFNTKRYNNWTAQRFLKELNMNSIDEGITLNQLISLYQKYKIGFHVVDYKYGPTKNYATLYYLIESNQLYEITRQH